MSKELIVAGAKAKLVSGQDELLGQVIGDAGDQMVAEFQASLPPVDANEQEKIDAAVAAKVAELQPVIDGLNAQVSKDAQDLLDLHAKADADLAAARQELADMTAKEQLEESAVADVKTKIDSVQASFDAIRALLSPQP